MTTPAPQEARMTEIEKLLAEATPGPWRICETTIHGRKYGGCWVEGPETDDGDGRPRGMLIPISGSGGSMSYTTRVVEVQCHDHNDANARLIALSPSLAAALLVAERALREMAAFDDVGAPEVADLTDSYGCFDEPVSVQVSRAALSEIEKLTGGGE